MAIESVGGSIASKIAELLVEPAIRQFRYMFCFYNFVQEFDEQMMNLALAFYRLQDAVDVAKRNAEEIEIDVNKWLEDAKNEIEGVNRLQNEKREIGSCFTWCPNWMRQFKLSNALAKKTETLRKLEENSRKFPKVSHKAPLQEIKFLPSKEFMLSKSSEEAFEQIMKALKDDNVNMIGLYGMGGVGKTTLVNEVGRRAKELQLFDEVLMATLSQNPNVIDIQDRKADRLGLRFDKMTEEGRADLLWQRLKTEKKILNILDDVWKDIDFQEIGIPFGDDHRGCLRDEDSDLNRVAKEVARECQGLPIALVAVGKAVEDNDIPIEWLTRYAVGYGLYQDVMSIEGARKRVYMEIENLKACCMLLGTDTEEYGKMHDLVRDVAIQIASEEYGFMVKAGFGLEEWPMSNKSFEGCENLRRIPVNLIKVEEVRRTVDRG
eukprot:XP_024449670.1 probable disease resistance protein At4g14610 [Populus trichocarpa]